MKIGYIAESYKVGNKLINRGWHITGYYEHPHNESHCHNCNYNHDNSMGDDMVVEDHRVAVPYTQADVRSLMADGMIMYRAHLTQSQCFDVLNEKPIYDQILHDIGYTPRSLYS